MTSVDKSKKTAIADLSSFKNNGSLHNLIYIETLTNYAV